MAELLASFSGLGKMLDGAVLVCDVTLAVAPGDIVGLTGPIGGGKTTALRMIAGLVRPDHGSGTVLGHDVTVPLSRRMQTGYMGQRLMFNPDLTTIENLRFHADTVCLTAAVEAIERVIAALGLGPFANQRAGSLCDGIARRLQFATTLLHQPRLLFLDEPCSGFDGETRELIWAVIRQTAVSGGGAVIATNDPGELARCTSLVPFAASRAGAQTHREACDSARCQGAAGAIDQDRLASIQAATLTALTPVNPG